MGLARACLAIGEDGPVVPFQALLDDVLAELIEHLFLCGVFAGNVVESERVACRKLDRLVVQAVDASLDFLSLLKISG